MVAEAVHAFAAEAHWELAVGPEGEAELARFSIMEKSSFLRRFLAGMRLIPTRE